DAGACHVARMLCLGASLGKCHSLRPRAFTARLRLVSISLHRLLHPECGVARAHGMILVCDWRTEKRHDPVAHHLVHRAFVPVDGFHHPLKDWVEYLARLLWITVSEQLHRALEVGEEYGRLFAFAFEGIFGGEDLLGKVLGSVGLRGREFPGRGPLAERRSTFAAELLTRSV